MTTAHSRGAVTTYGHISLDDQELWRFRKDLSINCQCQLQKCVGTS